MIVPTIIMVCEDILPRKEYEALAAKSNHRRAAISKHHTADSSLPLVYRDRAGGYQTV
jgi:hypothetical protein